MKHAITRRRAHPRAQQTGYSLIELSVALVIALFLLAGFFSILQNTRKTSTSQSQIAELQDNERIALTMISGVIEAGGYYPKPDSNTITDQLPAGGVFGQTGQIVYGTTNVNPALGDTLTVRYNADAGEDVIDCKGATNAASTSAAAYVNQFLIMQDSTTTPPYLACTTDGGNTYAKLVNNVAKLEVFYGVNSAATIANTTGVPVDKYVATADMAAAAAANPALWTNVYSVKVKLSFVNPLYAQPGQPTAPGQPATLAFTKVIGIMSRVGVDVVSFK